MQKKNKTYTSFKDAFREFEEQPRTEVWKNIEAFQNGVERNVVS